MNEGKPGCKSCGGSGKGLDGGPCGCRLDPEWAVTVHDLKVTNGKLQRELKIVKEVNLQLKEVLRHIAWEPIGEADASAWKMLADIEVIARQALELAECKLKEINQ